jgi:transposase InsO family protein
MCKVLQIAPSCYRLHAARARNRELQCTRAKRDQDLIPEVQRVWHANWQVYGADKVWKQMNREGIRVARCTVERLMRKLGLAGVRRGKRIRTTTPDTTGRSSKWLMCIGKKKGVKLSDEFDPMR